MVSKPLSAEELERFRVLHAEGLGRNEIARELGRSVGSVTNLARQAGVSFDRSATRDAVAAAQVDAKARRVALALGLLDDAEKLRQQLFERAHVYSFGGKDNTFEEAWINEPSFRDKRDLMAAVNTALSASLRLDQHDSDTQGLAAVDAWLRDMVGGE